MARAMFTDLWDGRALEAKDAKETLNKQLKALGAEVKSLLGRIVQATSLAVIGAYEACIE
ncbi:hypothetical protein DFP92_10790 [Yoonia sediminilitoris]|uniref:Uncharacterized protein n=2 Tax=Yoonia sediminilitoris TaxID=1286148 RepID=A0A2T6KES0_9RHOB|nr:hypothetical protein C8N45_10790 [Yoonia sediminilitoris]RCW94800.1 hypothetical protein DFP92_10790 [Yoonia sediminilitoris]